MKHMLLVRTEDQLIRIVICLMNELNIINFLRFYS